jgi:hypothetical protein
MHPRDPQLQVTERIGHMRGFGTAVFNCHTNKASGAPKIRDPVADRAEDPEQFPRLGVLPDEVDRRLLRDYGGDR